MADIIRTFTIDRLTSEAQVVIERDDGSNKVFVTNLAGSELTALLAVITTRLAALSPPPDKATRDAERDAREAIRAAKIAEYVARRDAPP